MRSKLNESAEISANQKKQNEQQHTSPITVTKKVRIRKRRSNWKQLGEIEDAGQSEEDKSAPTQESGAGRLSSLRVCSDHFWLT